MHGVSSLKNEAVTMARPGVGALVRTNRRRNVNPLSLPLLGLLLLAGATSRAAEGDGSKSEGVPYREISVLNRGLGRTDSPPNLTTPQAIMESLVDSVAQGNGDRAARCLNLGEIEPARQAEIGARLARQLVVLLDQLSCPSWDLLPDRPDGMEDLPLGTPRAKEQPEPRARSNILLQRVSLDDRDVELRLERVKTPDDPPVWVVSEHSVAHIPALYQAYAPTWWQKQVPPFANQTRLIGVSIWHWTAALLVFLIGGLCTWVVQRLVDMPLRWLGAQWATRMAHRLRAPVTIAFAVLLFHGIARLTNLLSRAAMIELNPILIFFQSIAAIWLLLRLVDLVSDSIVHCCRSRIEEDGGLKTQVSVGRHVVTLLILVGGSFYALRQFDWFRQYGVTLLASAGVTGVVLGVAAHRPLGNLFAGMLLAATEPVRAGDAILFEGNFGWIEEIAITYLVIRSWDLRRIVVPIAYFLDRPFQNWSRHSQQLLMPVHIYTDYRVDVEALREEFRRILENSPDWDQSFQPILQVTGCDHGVLELRGLCGAGSPGASWNLQCHVREKLIDYLRHVEGGLYLPRTRIQVVDGTTTVGSEAHPSHSGEKSATGHNGDRHGYGEREDLTPTSGPEASQPDLTPNPPANPVSTERHDGHGNQG
jgi:small-conductance mechanosensitive channel